jgi:hypothetical protein
MATVRLCDYAILTLCNEEMGLLEPLALHFTGSQSLDEFTKPFSRRECPRHRYSPRGSRS